MKNSKTKKPDFLQDWVDHPGFETYIGAECAFKIEVLAAIVIGEKLSAIAAKRGFTRQAAYNHARDARRAFNLGNG